MAAESGALWTHCRSDNGELAILFYERRYMLNLWPTEEICQYFADGINQDQKSSGVHLQCLNIDWRDQDQIEEIYEEEISWFNVFPLEYTGGLVTEVDYLLRRLGEIAEKEG